MTSDITPQTPATPHPLEIYRQAVQSGVAPEVLREIFELAKDYEQHEAAKKYAEALAGFQSECPMILKGREVKNNTGRLMYRFANYEDVKRITRPLERKYGITVSFSTVKTEGRFEGYIRIRVGNYFEDKQGSMSVPKGMNTNASQDDIQATSYFKRNLYCLALDIVTSDADNDGADLYEKVQPKHVEEINNWIDKCKEAGDAVDFNRFIGWLEVTSLDELPLGKLPKALAELRRKFEQAKGGKK